MVGEPGQDSAVDDLVASLVDGDDLQFDLGQGGIVRDDAYGKALELVRRAADAL